MSGTQQIDEVLPPVWSGEIQPAIRRRVLSSGRTIVVLDDDPTGTQTVHDTPVLTEWSRAALEKEFRLRSPLFFILTNSRGHCAQTAQRNYEQIAANLTAAGTTTGCEFTVISRSDSTLRGHFPLETDVLSRCLNLSHSICLIIPFFAEGGRLTRNDIHYAVEGANWTPVSETAFANDQVFGFRSSNLKEWVQEKTFGRVSAEDVHSIDLNTIRRKGPEAVLEQFLAMPANVVCIVNAVDGKDLDVVVTAMLDAEQRGRSFLCRTAASFVRARAGLMPKPLLSTSDFVNPNSEPTTGGLIIVGSHVRRATEQLQHLRKHTAHDYFEINVAQLLRRTGNELTDIRDRVDNRLAHGRLCIVSTSREQVLGLTDNENLQLSETISDALATMVSELKTQPRFMVAKGGITASDVATKGLGIRRAIVSGQILPGVPVWKPDPESGFPDLPYVVFPGNVGDEQALSDAVGKLQPMTNGSFV